MNSYELSRNWFDWCFEHPEKINPNHTAMYFFIIEHCNRLGWKEKFGLPMEMTKDAIGISNYRTFSKTFNDLVEWGFLVVHQKSKNQYSSNIIAIAKNTKAKSKALDKAMQNHSQKQVHDIVGIDKPLNLITTKLLNIKDRKLKFSLSLKPFLEIYGNNMLNDFYAYWTEHGENDKKMRFEKEKSFGVERRLSTWLKNENHFKEKSSAKKESEPKVGRMTITDAEKTMQNFANAKIPGLNG